MTNNQPTTVRSALKLCENILELPARAYKPVLYKELFPVFCILDSLFATFSAISSFSRISLLSKPSTDISQRFPSLHFPLFSHRFSAISPRFQALPIPHFPHFFFDIL